MKLINVQCYICGNTETSTIGQGPDFEYHTSDDEFTMVQCSSCGLVYLNPRPDSSELGTIYPDNYIPYRFDEHLSGFVNKLRMTVQSLKVKSLRKYVPKDAVVWDVGCGGGFFLECLRTYGKDSWQLTGVDVSDSAINTIQSKGFTGIKGRFEELDIPPDSVDVIVLNQVIEHLDNPVGVIKKAYSVLKPGGYFFVETPSAEGWDAKLFKRRYWGGWHFPRHWTIFTLGTLKNLLEKEGFGNIKDTWLLSPNFWAQSFHHWLIDKGVSEQIAGWMDCKNPFVLAFFSTIDLIQKLFGHTSNMRLVAQKRK